MADNLTPEEEAAMDVAIFERAKKDAERAYDENVARLIAAGIEPTEERMHDMMFQSLTNAINAFEDDLISGKFPLSNK